VFLQKRNTILIMEILTPGLGLLVWTFLAFVIVFLILKKFAWVPILSALKERETGIADAIASAEKIKAEMSSLKNENELLLNQAREERSAMIKEAKLTSDKMIAEAKEKARIEYDRIVVEAQLSIQQHKNAAIVEVKNRVGALVIEVSEKILQRELANKAEQEQYINQLTESIKLN
jgi:F-type H+-transporting ATPase subunit b